jgi:tRNA acetyltransferase TAN1
VNLTKNFNLLISTSRFNETNANAELWFTLLICGDIYPIISKLPFPGLISALTNIESKKVISTIRKTLESDPHFFQYILKIVPIDFVCETTTQILTKLVHEQYKTFISPQDSFKIVLQRRKHEKIDRNSLIEVIANEINNKVDLENPDKIIRIEVLGNYSGVSFLEKKDIIRIINE